MTNHLKVDESLAVLYSMELTNNIATAVWVSDNVTSITGYAPAQVIQPGWWNSLIHPDDQQVEAEVNRKLLHSGYITYEYRVMFANGEYHWIRDEMRIIHNNDQESIQILGVWSDITQERINNAKLRAHEERLNFVFEATGDCFWDWDINQQRVLFANNNWHLIGLEPTADGVFPAELWHELVHPDDSLLAQAAANRILTKETDRYNLEYRLRHSNGSWVWILARGKVIEYDSHGAPIRVIGLHTDITARKQNEQIAADRERMLNQLAQQVPGMLYQYVLDSNGSPHMPYVSDQVEQLYGVSADEVKKSTDILGCHVHPDDFATLQQSILASAHSLEVWRHVFRIINSAGQIRWIHGEANPDQQSDGSVVWYGYQMDVTADKIAEQELKLAANVFEHTHEGIIITDANKIIIEVNPTFTLITGYSRAEAIGQHVTFMTSQRHDQSFYQAIDSRLKQHGFWQGEVWNKKKDGTVYCERKTISVVCDSAGEVYQYVSLCSDVTKLKEQQQKLEQLAHYDSLTTLPNRSLLHDRLKVAMALATRNHCTLTIVYIDLDDFKPINDEFGHNAGDYVLRVVAQRLLETVRANDTVARIGGDEFIILLNNESKTGYKVLLRRLLEALLQPITFAESAVIISASLGVTHYPNTANSAECLIQQADQAMYNAKRNGKNQIKEFNSR